MVGGATTADGPGPTLHNLHSQWLEARGISEGLARKFGLFTTVQSFQNEETGEWEKAKCIAVPFRRMGRAVNHKYRRVEPKQFAMDKGGKRCFWNEEALERAAGGALVISEGEFDGMIAEDLGWAASSPPNGTPENASADPANERRYDYLWEARDKLARVERFILATDGDKAGLSLRQDLIALLGPTRCSFLEYPAGTKDLTDVYVAHGPEAVAALLNGAKPVPVQGLYRIDDFPERGEVVHWPLGIAPLADRLFVVPGTLTVLTGYANMGKSTVVDCLVAHLLRMGIPTSLASFETDVKPILHNGLRSAMLGCGLHEVHRFDTREVDALIRDKLTIITQLVDEDDEWDLDGFLDRCHATVLRDGAKVIILDPWNELEHKRRQGETETEYVGRALRAIRTFAKRNNVAFWVVAHPSKPFEGKVRMPMLLDISGSANWANKPDFGLTYHRNNPEVNEATLYVCKVRKGYPGRKGGVKVSYDFLTSQFVELAVQGGHDGKA